MSPAVATRAARYRAQLADHVVARSFVAETVLLDIELGRYYKLDRTAGAMLDALLAERNLAAAASALAAGGWGSDDELVGDLTALCDELQQLGLLRLQVCS